MVRETRRTVYAFCVFQQGEALFYFVWNLRGGLFRKSKFLFIPKRTWLRFKTIVIKTIVVTRRGAARSVVFRWVQNRLCAYHCACLYEVRINLLDTVVCKYVVFTDTNYFCSWTHPVKNNYPSVRLRYDKTRIWFLFLYVNIQCQYYYNESYWNVS